MTHDLSLAPPPPIAKTNPPATPLIKPGHFNSLLSFSHLPPFDPVFAERVPLLHAFSIALGNYRAISRRTRQESPRLLKLFNRAPAFCVAECGVYAGNSLLACAAIAQDQGIRAKFWGLDTFAGLPPLSTTDKELAPADAIYRTRTLFTETSVAAVRKLLADADLDNDVKLVPGLFSDTLPTLGERQYHFVNIDCDLYEPHIECLEYFYPRIAQGGILFFDDYHSIHFPMARHAIDHFMKDKPEKLQHLRFGDDGPNLTKTFFVKY